MAIDFCMSLMEMILYGICLAVPVSVILWIHPVNALLLAALVVAGIVVAAVIFMFQLIAIKRLLIGRLSAGRCFLTSRRAMPWILTDRLTKILERSPFRALINGNAFFRYFYYRAMGADIRADLMTGLRVCINEPDMVRAGAHVLLGEDCSISGHKVEHDILTLEPVEIGDHVMIGARSVILPGVRIGDRALIGTGAVVLRGTVINPGEVWAGNPAKRIERMASAAAVIQIQERGRQWNM